MRSECVKKRMAVYHAALPKASGKFGNGSRLLFPDGTV